MNMEEKALIGCLLASPERVCLVRYSATLLSSLRASMIETLQLISSLSLILSSSENLYSSSEISMICLCRSFSCLIFNDLLSDDSTS
jgi:hypothetical protein